MTVYREVNTKSLIFKICVVVGGSHAKIIISKNFPPSPHLAAFRLDISQNLVMMSPLYRESIDTVFIYSVIIILRDPRVNPNGEEAFSPS